MAARWAAIFFQDGGDDAEGEEGDVGLLLGDEQGGQQRVAWRRPVHQLRGGLHPQVLLRLARLAALCTSADLSTQIKGHTH
jgi:hypothetical protein